MNNYGQSGTRKTVLLNPNSPMPLYQQLSDLLADMIGRGRFLPGTTIPSEIELAKTYGIGRPTVRQAIDQLVKKRLVEKKRGSGTYVRQPEAEVDLFSLAGTSAAFQTRGIETVTSMLEEITLKTVSLDPDNPFSGRQAYFISRVTRVKKTPVLIEDSFLDPGLFSGIDRVDLENRSLARVVADRYYLVPRDGRQIFKVALAGSRTARHLELKAGDPVLEVKRVLNFPQAQKAVFSRMLCRTDRFAFAQQIPGQEL